MPANAAITSFPFYSRDIEATHKRHWCSEGSSFRQAVPANKLPTWALKNPGVGAFTVYARNLDTGLWGNITPLTTVYNTTVAGDVWRYYDWLNVNLVTTFFAATTKGGATGDDKNWPAHTSGCARMQLVVDAGPNTWYSEVFYVNTALTSSNQSPDDAQGFVFISAVDAYGSTGIPYGSLSFTQRLFLYCDVAEPFYEFTERGDSDGDDSLNRSFAKAIKRHRFTVYVPEYITDAMASFVVHGDVNITDQYGATWKMIDAAMGEPDWSRGACMASLEFSYRRDLWKKENC